MNKKNPFINLNKEQAKKMYRKLVMKYHPDKSTGSHEKFLLLSNYYKEYKEFQDKGSSANSMTLKEFFETLKNEYINNPAMQEILEPYLKSVSQLQEIYQNLQPIISTIKKIIK